MWQWKCCYSFECCWFFIGLIPGYTPIGNTDSQVQDVLERTVLSRLCPRDIWIWEKTAKRKGFLLKWVACFCSSKIAALSTLDIWVRTAGKIHGVKVYNEKTGLHNVEQLLIVLIERHNKIMLCYASMPLLRGHRFSPQKHFKLVDDPYKYVLEIFTAAATLIGKQAEMLQK